MESTEQQQQKDQPMLGLQRVYIKDISFETPGVPDVFQKDWKPEIELDLHAQNINLGNDHHEITLSVTVTAKSEGKTTFVLEIKQAGIFNLINFPADQAQHILNTYCPNVLYPYAREAVSDIVTRGSFPQLLLAPVNFDVLYAQHLEKEQAANNTETVN